MGRTIAQKIIAAHLVSGEMIPGHEIALRCKHCSGTTVLYSNEDRICAYCGGTL